MKTTLIATALSSLAVLASAQAYFEVAITFTGADGAYYNQHFPTDDNSHPITNSMVVYNISSAGGGFCTFGGVNGTDVVVFGPETVAVDPPQAMSWGDCQTD
ncbi:hypothetical protein BO71DRAFT_482002 [Aspergillus ellipticus CBS 707.79]|uniref:Uncharacterized protein n=1 Tax=Aspergillus ellipticus CBS 707.79 TaxID=1448320 RepID=A0A319DGL9_9EURO|nr:hypothetical protein BO71DRAFT_482002 [Aspergillus ellipticus CBS 707.79]